MTSSMPGFAIGRREHNHIMNVRTSALESALHWLLPPRLIVLAMTATREGEFALARLRQHLPRNRGS